MMIKVTQESRDKFLSAQVGKNADVLFETAEDGYYIGYTANYVSVKVKSAENLCGCIKNVKITDVETLYCVGTVNC